MNKEKLKEEFKKNCTGQYGPLEEGEKILAMSVDVNMASDYWLDKMDTQRAEIIKMVEGMLKNYEVTMVGYTKTTERRKGYKEALKDLLTKLKDNE